MTPSLDAMLPENMGTGGLAGDFCSVLSSDSAGRSTAPKAGLRVVRYQRVS